MVNKLKFYIGERHNPQLSKPYYLARGQMTAADAKKGEECLYGSIIMTPYESEVSYNNALADLKANGFRIR
jgi:hypothetical protein